MDQIFPSLRKNVDVREFYEIEERQFIAKQAKEYWLVLNMISSLDGSATLDGVSGGLGGDGDKLIFRILRSATDFILVAANTVREEKYKMPKVPQDICEKRIARGQSRAPRLVIISRTLAFDGSAEFLASPQTNSPQTTSPTQDEHLIPIIYTTTGAPRKNKKALEGRAEIRELGDVGVNLAGLLQDLNLLHTSTPFANGDKSKMMILAEGGPSLNAQLIAAGLVDELCLTLSPQIVGGNAKRIIQSPEKLLGKNMGSFTLSRILIDETGTLYLRYLKIRN